MLTAQDIKNISFSKSMNGYKREEVEIFLDTVESNYQQYEQIIENYDKKVAALEAEIGNFKNSQDSIQNVLLNAQKLADQIIREAKEKSEEIVLKAQSNIDAITEQEKELAAAFENKANERKNALQKELDLMIEKANIKAASITKATEDSVQRQQVLFDKLKLDISAFKSNITSKYKEHLSLLQTIPDTVDMEPQKIASVLTQKIDALPDVDSFLPKATPEIVKEDDTVADISSGFSVEETE